MRTPHKLTGPKGTGGYPKRLISFDTETWGDEEDNHHLTMGWATLSLYDDGKYRTIDSIEFTTIDQFWNFVCDNLSQKQSTYVVAHNILFDMRILDFSNQLVSRGFKAGMQFIPEQTGPVKLGYSLERYKLYLFNLGNWWGQVPLRLIGELLDFPKGDINPTEERFNPDNGCVPGSEAFQILSHYCRRDTDIVTAAVEAWVKFCIDNDLGPCAMTQAGQAFTAYRHRFMTTDIYIHDNVKAIELEKAAYFGGLTDNFKVGEWVAPPSEVLRIADVKSMYPSVMTTIPMPVKLVTYQTGRRVGKDANIDYLSSLEKVSYVERKINANYAVVARVRIDTTTQNADPRYLACVPHLNDDKLLYPIGKFETCLNTPELRVAIERGIVVDILEVAIYEQAIIFDEYVNFFFNLRAAYRSEGNTIMENICKLFLNALYGKFGQAVYEWEKYDIVTGVDRTETIMNVDTGEKYLIREMSGISQRRSDKKQVSENSFLAIAGHVTSAARAKLRRYIEMAEFDNVGYTDTDSLFINEEGYQNLLCHGVIRDNTLGYLEIEEKHTSDRMQLFTLKDYKCWRNGECVKSKTKGIRHNAERGHWDGEEWIPNPDGPHYRQVQFQGIASSLRNGNLSEVKVHMIVKKPTHAYSKGWIDDHGTVWPWKIDNDTVTGHGVRPPGGVE